MSRPVKYFSAFKLLFGQSFIKKAEFSYMTLGLRAKSALALGLCIVTVLLLASLAGWRALTAIEANLGSAFVRNVTQYNKQRILAPVSREVALAQRLADSEVTRRWMEDENNPAKKSFFFAEAERYRSAFENHSYSAIVRASRHYYYNSDQRALTTQPIHTLNPHKPSDAWFFNTLKSTRDFNLNVQFDTSLKITKVWINVLVKDGPRRIGVAGTGLDLTSFLQRFITNREAGVTSMILNRKGQIQAHPNPQFIDYASVDDKGAAHSTLVKLLPVAAQHAALENALERAAANSEQIAEFQADMDGKRQLFAVAYIPELKWFAVTSVDVQAAQVIDSNLWMPLVLGGALLLLLLVGAITIAVNRILLVPLFKLTDSVRSVGQGNYDIQLPPAGTDEMGELTRAFGAMAAQVRSHTDELESKVARRTRELVEVNKQVSDSIQCASLIQNAILPDRELAQHLAAEHFVMWKPRDVVGGDFYVFRGNERGCLIGVVDCAGHGVPGAFMTMIAYAVLNIAIDSLGLENPAALLTEMDAKLRAMLKSDPRGVATNMDAGLAYVDLEARTVTFSGAKISLYWSDGRDVVELKGDRAAVGGKRLPNFENETASLDQATFYLTTDGLLDQAGGPKGFSFGGARFAELLKLQAGRDFAAQKEAFARELTAYQGELSQRDDITLISFRFA